MRVPDDTDTSPLDDEFFRQLAGGTLAETDPPRARRPQPQPPRALRGGTDPHGPHPIGTPDARDAHRSEGARSHAAPDEPPPRARRRRGRLAAGSSLAIAALAVALVALGSDDEQPGRASRGAPNGSPSSDEARLRVVWAADGSDNLRARWRAGATATIAGRLTVPGGQPVAGARVSVLAADARRPGEGNRTVGELRTDRRGRFRAAIAVDRGAPRKLLSFSYLAYGDDTVPAAIARARLDVEAPISLHAPHGRIRPGGRVELHGYSAPRARVRLLADPPGASVWQPLAKVRAAGDGRWLAEVQFPRDALSGRYRLRARVAANPRLGYLAAASRPLEVEVR